MDIFSALKILFYVGSGVASYKSYKKAKKLEKQANQLLIQKYGTGGGIPVAYGTRRVAGTVLYANTINNRELFVVYAIAVGEIDSIGNIKIGGRSVADTSVFDHYIQRNSNYFGSTQDEINRILANQDPPNKPRMVFNCHLGETDQVADPMLVGCIPEWTSNHRLRGIAYIAANFDYDSGGGMFTGLPEITCDVRGKKLYDPRLDSTVTNGSGSHRINDPSTYSFSDNSSLVLLDYLTNTEYGKSLSTSVIDMQSFMDSANKNTTQQTFSYSATVERLSDDDTLRFKKTTANLVVYTALKVGNPITIKIGSTTYASGTVIGKTNNSRRDAIEDEYKGDNPSYIVQDDNLYIIQLSDGAVTTPIDFNPTAVSIDITSTQDRFPFNGVIDTEESVFDNAKKILANMRGIFNYINGIYSLKIEDSESVALSIDDDDILESGIKVSVENKEEKYNIVEVEFANAQKDYELDTINYKHTSETPGENYTYDDGGEELKLTMEMPYVTNANIAYQNAKAVLLRSRNNKNISFTGTHKLLYVKVGELISITNSQLGMSNEQYRVTRMTINHDLTININAIIYQSNIYGYVTPPTENIDIPDDMVDSFKTDAPTNLNFVDKDPTTGVQPYLTWTNPTTYPAYEFRVIVKDSNDNVKYDGRTKNNFFNLTGIEVDTGYTAEVKSLNTNYVESKATTYNFNNSVPPVQNDDLGSGSVTDEKVSDISADKITAGTIDASVITVTNLDADNITSGSIGADKITVDDLSAINSDLGDIDAGSLNIGSGAFVVTTAGAMTATSATVTGNITATSLNVTNASVTGTLDASVITVDGQDLSTLIAYGTTTGQDGNFFKINNQLDLEGKFYWDAGGNTNYFYLGSGDEDNVSLYITSSANPAIVLGDEANALGSFKIRYGNDINASYNDSFIELDGDWTTGHVSSGTPETTYTISGETTITNPTVGIKAKTTTPLKLYFSSDANQNDLSRVELSKTTIAGSTTTPIVEVTQGSAPSTTANKLYNIGGSLYWNGAVVDTGAGDITGVTINTSGGSLTGGASFASGDATFTLDIGTTVRGSKSFEDDVTFESNVVIEGNLDVQGTTTTIDTTNLDVKDKNITLNYGTGDTSANANGAGITIQDAVSSTQDATLTWNTANDSFNFSHDLNFADSIKAQFGTNNDLQIQHTGSNSSILHNGTGNLNIQNSTNDTDLNLLNDDGSGGTTTYFKLDGSLGYSRALQNIRFDDNVKATFGAGNDLEIYHDATDSYIQNATGNLEIRNNTNDGDINFRSDNGSGGLTTYFAIDGGAVVNRFYKDAYFTDNVKAKFGNSSDLQIYHDGSHSYIQDSGSGNLRILVGDMQIRNYGTNENIITSTANAEVALYYNASEKLATSSTGINVAGTVTSDGLTVDGASTFNTSSTLFANLNYSGANLGKLSTDGINLNIEATSNLLFKVNSATRAKFDGNGDIFFYEDTGTTAKLFWDASAESLGIGTTSPSSTLDISDSFGAINLESSTGTNQVQLKVLNTGGSAFFGRENSAGSWFGTGEAYATTLRSDGAYPMIFRVNGGNRLVLDDGGNVGIGTTLPTVKLEIQENTNSTDVKLRLRSFNSSSAGRSTYIAYDPDTRIMGFGEGGDEVNIDQNGNLLVGTTNASGSTAPDNSSDTNNAGLRLSGSLGFIGIGSNSQPTTYLNRIGSDGDIAIFKKSGSTVGSIGTQGSVIRVGSGNNNLGFFATRLQPLNSSGAGVDGTIDLGYSTSRFKDLHLSGTANFGSLSDGTITITGFVDEDNMSSDSATLLPTQQSVKAYVDANSFTINNNADNRIITGTATAGTLNAETTLTYDASILKNVGSTTGGVPPILRLEDVGSSGKLGDLKHSAGTTILTSRNATSNGVIKFEGYNGTSTTIYGGFDASGNFEIGTTDVITSARNLVNIGTISSGAISSSGNLTLTQSSGLNTLYLDSSGGGNPVIYLEDSNRKWGVFVSSSNLHFKDENGQINALILSAGGNATFAGSISSGAITSTGDTSITGNLSTTGGITVGDSSADALRFVGVLKQGSGSGTTVMDASRNLTNIGTISSGAITTSGYFHLNASHTVYAGAIDTTSTATTSYNVIRFNQGSGSGAPTGLIGTAGSAVGNTAFRSGMNIGTQSSGSLNFIINDGLAGKFDTSGNLLVGKTSDDGTAGVRIGGSGTIVPIASGIPIIADRLSSDGEIIRFRKDGSTVGSIGVNGGALFIVGDTTSGNGAGLKFIDGSTERIVPATSGGGEVDNLVDLGQSTHRFKDLYLSGTANVNIVNASNVINGLAYQISGTEVINSARNLVNIGTISSGAITSTGDIQSDKFKGNTYSGSSFLDFDDDNGVGTNANTTTLASIGNMNFIVDTNGNGATDKFYWLKDNTAPNSATQLMDLDKNANLVLRNGTVTGQSGGFFGGDLELYNSSDLIIGSGGTFKFGTTVIVDASRNLTNIGTISSGAITSSSTITTQADSASAGIKIKRTNASTAGARGYIGFMDSDNNFVASIDSRGTGVNNSGDLRFFTSTGQSYSGVYNNPSATLILGTDNSATFAGTISSGAITATTADFSDQVTIQSSTSTPFSSLFSGSLVVKGSSNEDPIIAVTDSGTANAAAGVFHQSSTSPGFPALVINAASNGSEQPLISARTNVNNSTGIGGTEVFAVDGDGDATFAGTISSGNIYQQSPDVGGVTPPNIYIGQLVNAYQAGIQSSTHLTFKTTNGLGNWYWYRIDALKMSLVSSDLNLHAGGYQINGTTVIDSSRNLTNIGTISSGVLSVNGGTTNVVATFQSTDGIAGIKLQDSGGNVELSAQGSTFRVQPNGSNPVLEIDSSGNTEVGGHFQVLGDTQLDGTLDVDGSLTVDDGALIKDSKSSSNAEILTIKNTSTTNEGRYVQFNDNAGVDVGQIGHVDQTESNIFIATFSTGLKFESYITYKAILPCDGDGADSDNAIDLGSSSVRFDDIYATNGSIQTSDRNEKQDIQALTDAEQRVATACKGLIRRFRWQDSVAEKDNNPDSDETARYHFGVIAQDLQDAFTAEGLDAGDYGMFISSTWTDDDGVEQTRLGVRYNELLSFIISTL